MRRRLISAVLLLGFCLAFAAPMFALHAAESAKMACCKRGQGNCCHTRRHKDVSFEASTESASQCRLGAASLQPCGLLAAPAESGITAPAFHSPVSAVEEALSRSSSYLAFLYQLPPPEAAR